MISYELWMQRVIGGLYAVRLNDCLVTGAVGPLSRTATARRREIAPAEYEDVVVTARLEAHRSQYTVVDSWADTDSHDLELNLGAVSCIQWEIND
jgi:hypothetical protein